MKKTTAITLTLLSAAALAGCSKGSERVLAGYRDPTDTTRTSSRPRVGFVPFYRNVYRGDRRSDGSGGGTAGGYRGVGTAHGGEGGHVGGVSRGGFGGTGGGRAAGA